MQISSSPADTGEEKFFFLSLFIHKICWELAPSFGYVDSVDHFLIMMIYKCDSLSPDNVRSEAIKSLYVYLVYSGWKELPYVWTYLGVSQYLFFN